MKFRPCIDLHDGIVKQIVGGTLDDGNADALQTNFAADKPAEWFARLYRRDNLTGGHVIQLGSGNGEAARSALEAWPGGLQLGGGVTAENAPGWIEAGAGAVIVTSWVFHGGRIDFDRLDRLRAAVGREHLVLDLSCRRKQDAYRVVTDRWQTFTDEVVDARLLERLSAYCCEYLVHGVDVEGRCAGIEEPLVRLLGGWGEMPVTYAGGIRSRDDIALIGEAGHGRVDFTVGSALDIFGGPHLTYAEMAGYTG